MNESEPNHHRLYRLAWESYIDPDTPKSCKRNLEKEMDSAQNHFCWDEFQEFKETLPGYIAHWEGLKADLDRKLLEKFKEEFE